MRDIIDIKRIFNMKKLFVFIVSIFSIGIIMAQSPQKMSYQCVVRNGSGVLVTNHSVGIRISILQGSSTGSVVYQETYSPGPQTNANGLVSIEIGGGGPVTGTFSSIDWSTGSYFLKTETDPTGGTNYTIIGTSQLLSVPYAFHAQTAGSSADAVKITGDQIIAGHKTFNGITTVGTPVNGTDAANKAYVDLLLKEINFLKDLSGISSVTDIDGNTYLTKRIGSQIWMAENLRTTTYNNGDSIGTTIPLRLNIMHETAPKFQWGLTEKSVTGRFYTWYAIMDSRTVCPTGWHVPSDTEWKTLEMSLGMTQMQADSVWTRGTNQGSQLKNTTGWDFGVHSGKEGIGTNSSGFSAIAVGYRGSDGMFEANGMMTFYWSSSETSATEVWTRSLVNEDMKVRRFTTSKNEGYSVRCIKD
jgi:uncharacterized protein (TIGR02145 family)